MRLFGGKGKRVAQPDGKQRERRSVGVMNVILVIVGISLLAFTVAMIWLFTIYGAVPDTLVTCVFATLGGECGIMGWIKTTKDRARERKWEVEDRKAEGPESDHPRNNL